MKRTGCKAAGVDSVKETLSPWIAPVIPLKIPVYVGVTDCLILDTWSDVSTIFLSLIFYIYILKDNLLNGFAKNEIHFPSFFWVFFVLV